MSQTEQIKIAILELKYVPDEANEENVRIFGKRFVNRNRDKCIIIYKDVIFELKEFFEDINIAYNHKDEFTIKLRIYKTITDLSYMFAECFSLVSIREISDSKDTSSIKTDTNIEMDDGYYDYYNNNNSSENNLPSLCYNRQNIEGITDAYINENENNPLYSSLSSLNKETNLKISDFKYKSENLSKKNSPLSLVVPHCTNMSFMFGGCNSLECLPDLSNLNTSSVTNMRFMFFGCCSLKSLPDISDWDTSNVDNIEWMFCQCNSLMSLPGISKWNTSNVYYMMNLFAGCKSLKSLPDISQWNISKVGDISALFCKCSSLDSLPDISKWNTSNIINGGGLFSGCNNLKSFPEISYWNTSNITNMSCMFEACISID